MASERLCSRLSCGFTTHSSHTSPMNEKRMSARAESRSVPASSSIWLMMCSMASSSFWSRPSASVTSPSPSTSFVAAKRTGMFARAAWSSTRWQIPWMQRCSAPWSGPSAAQKSRRPGCSRKRATVSACSTSSPMPSFFAALIGTTGMPRSPSSLFTSTVPPLDVSSSIMFRASTIGRSSSMSWSVR